MDTFKYSTLAASRQHQLEDRLWGSNEGMKSK